MSEKRLLGYHWLAEPFNQVTTQQPRAVIRTTFRVLKDVFIDVDRARDAALVELFGGVVQARKPISAAMNNPKPRWIIYNFSSARRVIIFAKIVSAAIRHMRASPDVQSLCLSLRPNVM